MLTLGSRGDEVKKLQTALNTALSGTAGFTPLKVDGIYGNLTKGAVSAYQTANSLKVDGIFGPQTSGSLYTTAAPAAAPAITPVAAPAKDYSSGVTSAAGPSAPVMPIFNDYQSKWDAKIEEALSALDGIKPFKWNMNSDPAFQAFMQQYQSAGKTAFQNQIGAMSAMTGGELNSWATSSASQAQNSFIQQGMSQAPQFMNAAYSKYRDGISDIYQKADFLLGLDDRDYQRFKDDMTADYQKYEYEFAAYQQALDLKSSQFADALDRTKLNGFVSNEDSILLGVKAGTPSYEAAQATREKEAWLEQQQAELADEKALIAERLKADKELVYAREAASGSGSGGSGQKPKYSSTQKTEIKNSIEDFNEYVNSTEYRLLNDKQKADSINAKLQEIYDYNNKGLIDDDVTEAMLQAILESAEYKRLFVDNDILGNMMKSDEFKSLLGGN